MNVNYVSGKRRLSNEIRTNTVLCHLLQQTNIFVINSQSRYEFVNVFNKDVIY